MRAGTEIVRRHEQESPFLCSACGADRGCDCNAPAVERLAKLTEQRRQARKAYRERERADKEGYPAPIENTEESEPEIEGDDAQTIWRRGLIFRAKSASAGAQYENWKKFKVDRQLVEEANEAAAAWTRLAEYLERLYHGKAS